MKDIVLQFKNFLYQERKSEDEKRELLRDLEDLAKWGDLTQERIADKIKTIRLSILVRFDGE